MHIPGPGGFNILPFGALAGLPFLPDLPFTYLAILARSLFFAVSPFGSISGLVGFSISPFYRPSRLSRFTILPFGSISGLVGFNNLAILSNVPAYLFYHLPILPFYRA